MARRRGILAEIQHQQRLSEARANAAARAQSQARAQAQRARAAQERAKAASARATEAERKQYEREAKAAYLELRAAEVEELNDDLAVEYAEIDGLLAETLRVDDFVDLESLKIRADHPPFPRRDLETPTPAPSLTPVPPAPVYIDPPAPTGLFGKRKKFEDAQQKARAEFDHAYGQWEAYRDWIPTRDAQLANEHAELERGRIDLLTAERERYDAACRVREAEVAEQNSSIDNLIAGLGYGAIDAVQEYVGIVLANSVYPDSFPVEHDAEFDAETAELRLHVTVPAPDTLRTVKSFRYVKATDEVVETQLSKAAANERYASALHQVALRSLHEIFEADRRGLIQAISAEVGPETNDPATGRRTFIPLVAVAVSREMFMEIDLSGVVPLATLQHLGAAVAKSPSTLAAVDTSGVRRS
ncbi:hypothetical protein HRK28_15070 [Rathayibacter sp. VKM Ac-2835]|uniref:hypothetical protein n=1 Tax=Rathayibacter sp. VKM Ac-2835 TaxID=2739043 RepID=UPI00156550C8|nr:hypothetical protein [Rathayibacter sp. VKM Ac-2835]NRG42235.1 hypothetical protein [Rathayibacter sp. VKM Ac-2835]